MKRPTKINTTDDGEIPVIRWSNRRKMAWYALIAIIAGTALFWFALPLWFTYWTVSLVWIPAMADAYTWFVSLMAIVVVTYLGFKGDLPFLNRLGGWSRGGRGSHSGSGSHSERPVYVEPEEEETDGKEEEYYDASKH